MFPQLKSVLCIAPVSKTNGATATGVIDTLGYDWLTLDLSQATADVVSNKLSVCKLTEGDTTVISNAAAITEFTGGGVGGFTIPSADTSNSQLYKFNVDLRKRKRYLFLTVSPQTTQLLTAIGNLGRGEEAPITASKAGVGALIEG